MTTSFGFDLAGYSTDGSALVAASIRQEKVFATILGGSCFSDTIGGDEYLSETCDEEIRCLRSLLDHGPVFVDVPIDLQELPCPKGARFIWQLTRRPVDRAFNALSPLADRIGSYVARMQNLWRMLREDGKDPLGETLFEMYPAASLRLSNRCCEGYKGCCDFRDNSWRGTSAKNDRDQKKNDQLARLLNSLNWSAEEGFHFTNDEFDAAICGITGLFDRLEGDNLEKEINARLNGTAYKAPKGYSLLKSIPTQVHLLRAAFPEFIK